MQVGLAGMLPSTKSSLDALTGFEGFGGFHLPGHGEAYAGCGVFYTKGCLNVDQHVQDLLDASSAGNAYIEKYMSTCLRSSCPICYEKWAAKEAHKIEYRLGQVKWFGPVIHVVASVPSSLEGLVLTNYPRLRRLMYKAVKNVGFKGGSVIFHPFRRRCLICGSKIGHGQKKCSRCMSDRFTWYFSPHFHLLGFGWIQDVATENKRSGWVVVNLGIRDSVFATAMYQLSHCGIHSDYHSVTWFGVCSYNKLRVPPEVVVLNRCPLCGAELLPVRWVGDPDGDPLEGHGEGGYWIDPGGWAYMRVSRTW